MRRAIVFASMWFCLLGIAIRAGAQVNFVDCSGVNSWAYPNISSALANTGNGGVILVFPGTCYEDVGIYNMNNLAIGALSDRVAVQGTFTVYGSDDVYLFSLDFHSSYGDGVSVNSSRNVQLNSCTSSNNPGSGVVAFQDSYVYLGGTGNYSGNGYIGINLQQNSMLVLGLGGQYIFDNNNFFGINASASNLFIWGNSELANNTGGPYYGGNGIHMDEGSRGVLNSQNGDNRIFGNQSAGIFLDSHSTLEITGGAYLGNSFQNYIDDNGPTGIIVQGASQLSLGAAGYITGHSGAAVDIEGNSQVIMSGDNNFIQNNRGPGFNIRANSEADLWGGVITGNDVGVVASSNSSMAVTASLSPNAHGPIQCDSSSYLSITNLTPSMLGPANGCKITGGPGVNPSHTRTQHLAVPNWKPQRDAEDKFRKLASQYHK
jgi:Right handed beta helix region